MTDVITSKETVNVRKVLPRAGIVKQVDSAMTGPVPLYFSSFIKLETALMINPSKAFAAI